MNELSPSANRISAALRALRQVYADSVADQAVLGLKSLQAIVTELAAEGVPPDDLKPLADLETLIAASSAAPVTPAPKVPKLGLAERQRDQRRQAPPSNTLLARSAAVIDLLVKDGQGEEGAAQTVMRHLMVAGVPAPSRGGDSRGWRRLLEFRNTLVHGGGPEDARIEYAAFSRELDEIPLSQRVNAALTERLWDRPRQARRQAG